jgi:endonuclease YncB( thermonuclease family)
MLARRLPPGTRILIARDPTLDDRDDYERLLRYVYVLPLNVNVELVRDGLAVPYFFRGRRGIYADELLAAAKNARRSRRGLWGACPGAKLDPNRGALTGPAS